MNAVNELKDELGLDFKMHYSRLPFFLRPGEEGVRSWIVEDLGLPRTAERGEVISKMFGKPGVQRMDGLFESAGLVPYWGAQLSDTMNSHRLAWYAASESDEKGELMWRALSRRYFEGLDTQIRPIRLDSVEMLMECAQEVGLDLERARQVLQSEVYKEEILRCVGEMHAVGINSIPVLVFEVEGIAEGSWLQNPKAKGRMIHHGSGSKEEFKSILRDLDKISSM